MGQWPIRFNEWLRIGELAFDLVDIVSKRMSSADNAILITDLVFMKLRYSWRHIRPCQRPASFR